MFYYFGRKKRIAGLYPEPSCELIIEPFAGSAAYSLHGERWKKQVILSDTNPMVVGIWKYLLAASKKDIAGLPELKPGEKTTDFPLSKVERDLIGLHINPGSSVPKITATPFSRWGAGKKYILANLEKVRHWQVHQQSFAKVPNLRATWFIDPPYQQAGKNYSGGNAFDFQGLGAWCRSRAGEIIVCEAYGADWLPFSFLTTTKNAGKNRCHEVVYHRSRT